MRRASFKRYLLATLTATSCLGLPGLAHSWSLFGSDSQWPAWEGYKAAFVSEDGRVVDHSMPDKRTVSEGQAYGLFFALVANDRATFDSLLNWTTNNLAKGDLRTHLPAWHWGDGDNGWGVIDSNSASDADVLIAYVLLEASRLWCDPTYASLAKQLGNTIQNEEVLWINGLGRSLLPGKVGFLKPDGLFKLNPSYVPTFVMARLANAWADDSRWAELYLGSQQLLLKGHVAGLYPDWLTLRNGQLQSLEHPGDYDAIRVYLWLGITSPHDPIMPTLLSSAKGFAKVVQARQQVPEQWLPTRQSVIDKSGPTGFQYALEPLLKLLGLSASSNRLPALPSENDIQGWRELGYYNSSLSLFSSGHLDGYYLVDTRGKLTLKTLPNAGGCSDGNG